MENIYHGKYERVNVYTVWGTLKHMEEKHIDGRSKQDIEASYTNSKG